MCDVNRNNEITQPVEDVKKSSTPAGCNIAGARLDKIFQLHDLSWTQKPYCTPLGCGSAANRFYKYVTPLGCGSAANRFYKYVTPLG